MMGNQYKFEVIRDLITIISKLENDKEVVITVKRHPNNSLLFDWKTSMGECYGSSEVANAIKDAYEAARKGKVQEDKNCDSCHFQQKWHCHFNPPIIVVTNTSFAGRTETIYPGVRTDDWCSHWEK